MRYERVVGLGLCVIDRTYLVDDLASGADRLRFRERRESVGGMTTTALCQAAALGCEAHLVSALGDDADARLARRELRRLGVRTRRLLLSKRLETTTALVLVDRATGERRFIVPDRRPLESCAPRLDVSAVDRRSVLLLDAHFPDDALRAAKHARRVGARVVADFNRPSPAALRLLPLVDHAIVPQEFADAWGVGPRELLAKLAHATRDTPVLTQGPKGALTLEGARLARIPPRRARVVDTTGAGDVFHGAFAAGLCLGLDFRGCLDLATRAAARSCEALGGSARLTTRDELPASLRSSAWRAKRGR